MIGIAGMRSLEESIFWELFFGHHALRSDLARQFTMSPATVSRAVNSLLKVNLIVETGGPFSARGRKPTQLVINPQLAYLGGIEFDRNRITAVVTSCDGNLLGRGCVKTSEQDPVQRNVRRCREALEIALDDAGLERASLARVCVGHTGKLEPGRGICLGWDGIPHWESVPLAKELRECIGVEVSLEDRARGVALAEHLLWPENRIHRTAIYVQVGTGIGAGIFVDGRLLKGLHSAGTEIGHIVIDRAGPVCVCGGRGCVEAFASTAAILRDVKNRIAAGQKSRLRRELRYGAELTIDAVVTAAKEGDEVARSAIIDAGEALGVGIANAIQLLSPSLVVLAGDLAKSAGSLLLETIRSVIARQCFEPFCRDLEVRVAKVRKDSTPVGCALLAAQVVLQEIVQQRLFGTAA